MPMTEARIILPDPVMGRSVTVHRELRRSLIESFGGVTLWGVQGAWIDAAGDVVEDQSICYLVAGDWNRPGARNRIIDLALRAGVALDQDCVYLSINGEVQLLPCK